MTNLKKRFVRSMVAGTITMATFIGTAYADGLKSQWKTRLPMRAGIVDVKTSRVRTSAPQKKTLKVQHTDEAVPRLITQRKERLQTRVLKKGSVQKSVQVENLRTSTSFGGRDKIRSIKRMQKPANHCGTLHTHAKARCLRDLSYRKTNQYRAHLAKAPTTTIVATLK